MGSFLVLPLENPSLPAPETVVADGKETIHL
jgi:hypothetical protein